MDIYKAIEQLKAEKKRLDAAIEALEQAGYSEAEPRRARVWNADARRNAAERMRLYWERRRARSGAVEKETPRSPQSPEAPLTGPPEEA